MTAGDTGTEQHRAVTEPAHQSLAERILTLGKQSFIYGLSGAALQAVGILTLPFFARVFSPAKYGILEIAAVGYSALATLADSGLTSAAQRSYYDYGGDQEHERRSALLTGLTASLTLGALIAVPLVVFAPSVSQWSFGNPHYASVVRIVAVTVPAGTLAAFAREVMRLKFRPWSYTISALIGSLGGTLVAVASIVFLDMGVEGIVFGTLVGTALAAAYGLVTMGVHMAGRFSRPELRTMASYGLPLVPAAAALWGLNFVDRVMLAKLGSLADTGEYAVANRFAMVLILGVTAFTTAFGPFQLSLWQENPELEKRVRDQLLSYLTLLLASVGVVVAVFAQDLALVITPAFTRSYRVVGLLAMGVTLWGISNIVLFGIGIVRRTGYVAAFTVAALGLNVGLNFLLIPPFGMVGASVANLAAYTLLAVTYYWKSQQLYPTEYHLDKPLKTLGLACVAMAVGAAPLGTSGLAFAARVGTIVAFGVSLWLLKIVDERELTQLRAMLRRARSLGRQTV